jgi:hypothetical protein
VDLRFLRAKESIRLSFLINPRSGGHAVLRREGGLHQQGAETWQSVCSREEQKNPPEAAEQTCT